MLNIAKQALNLYIFSCSTLWSLKQKGFEPFLLGCMEKPVKKEEEVIDIIKKVDGKIKVWIKFVLLYVAYSFL